MRRTISIMFYLIRGILLFIHCESTNTLVIWIKVPGLVRDGVSGKKLY